jgi:RNA polymerase-binding transcription factor DksA
MKRYHFIYEELRRSKEELLDCLQKEGGNSLIISYIQAELNDVEHALAKIEAGDFGKCEMSGELLPEGLLGMVPTARTEEDIKMMEAYLRKPLYS